MPGATNPSDIFTKEDNDIQHFESLRDIMVKSREAFSHSQDNRWGVLKNDPDNIMNENTTNSTGNLTQPNAKIKTDETKDDALNFLNPPNDIDGIYVGTIFCPAVDSY